VHAVAELVPEGVQRPHQRLPVGHGHVGTEHGGAQRRVLAARHHGVHRGHADVALVPALGRLVDPVQRARVIHERQRHAEQILARRHVEPLRGQRGRDRL
jgi:hypothetical protein